MTAYRRDADLRVVYPPAKTPDELRLAAIAERERAARRAPSKTDPMFPGLWRLLNTLAFVALTLLMILDPTFVADGLVALFGGH
jgi:hypothetical protein